MGLPVLLQTRQIIFVERTSDNKSVSTSTMSLDNYLASLPEDVREKCSLLLNDESKVAYTVNRHDCGILAECQYSVETCDIARHNFTEGVYLLQALISPLLGKQFLESTEKLQLNVPVFFARVLELGGFIRIFYNAINIRACVGESFRQEFTFEYQSFYEIYLRPLEDAPDFADTAKIINILCMP